MGWLKEQIRWRRQSIFVIDQPDQIVEVPGRVSLEMIPVNAENVERARSFRQGPTIENFRQFLRLGYLGLFAAIDDRVVGHAWAATCEAHPALVCGYFRIRPDESLILYCNVAEEFRGRQIYPAMLGALTGRLFRETAVRRVYVDTSLGNLASKSGIAKAGFRPVGTGTYLQVRGRLVIGRLSRA